jgi:UDP-glucuronate decarboxylase
MPRAVVTGGAGFVGSHVCDALRGRDWEVVAVDNFMTSKPGNVAHLRDDPGFTLVEHDVVEALPVDGPVDAVLHLASPASPPEYLAHPIETLEVGSIGTSRALDLAREHDARFLLASTSEIYGDPLVHPQPETYFGNVNSVGPRSVYDEAKRYAEAITMAYHRTHGVDTKIVRVFNSILADEQVLYDDGTSFRREAVQDLANRLGGPCELADFSVPSFDDECRVLSHVATHLVAHPPTGRCFEVRTRYGRTIRVTGDHSLFVEGASGDPVARRVEDLRPGDRVALAGRIDVTPRDRPHACIVDMWDRLGRDPWRLSIRAPGLGHTVWAHRHQLRPLLHRHGIPGPDSSPQSVDSTVRRWRDRDELPLAAHRALAIPIPPDARVRERSSNSRSLPRTLPITNETLWLLGLFVAEGCHFRSRRGAFITMSCSEDLLERAAKVIERDLGLHVVWGKGSKQRSPAIFVHSRLLLEVLDDLGFLAATKRIPGWVLGLPLARLKWFIEGYREGDGVHSGVKFEQGVLHEFSTTSSELKDDLVVAFGRFGLVASVGEYVTRFRKRTGSREYPFWRLTLSRVEPWNPLDWDRGVSQALQSRRSGDLVWAPVRAVDEVAPTDLVYDFCVPGVENFVAGGGIMAHNTYGPRLRAADGRVVSNFLAQAMRGQPLTVYGDGKQTRSFCYVSDEVAGLLALLDSDYCGPMNIGNPDEFTMLELAELVLEVTGATVDVVFEALPADDPKQRRPDISLAQEVLGWHPTVDLREGLARTHDWYRRQRGN